MYIYEKNSMNPFTFTFDSNKSLVYKSVFCSDIIERKRREIMENEMQSLG